MLLCTGQISPRSILWLWEGIGKSIFEIRAGAEDTQVKQATETILLYDIFNSRGLGFFPSLTSFVNLTFRGPISN
jgi:hypothetical protein